jgi:hypothetical protein
MLLYKRENIKITNPFQNNCVYIYYLWHRRWDHPKQYTLTNFVQYANIYIYIYLLIYRKCYPTYDVNAE